MIVFIVREGCDHIDSLCLWNAEDLHRFQSYGYCRIEPQSVEMSFFDLWCVDERTVTAIEVHPDKNTLERFRRFSACKCLSFSPFPIIWLGSNRYGNPQGLEAFVGFEIHEAADKSLAILVDPLSWSDFSFPQS